MPHGGVRKTRHIEEGVGGVQHKGCSKYPVNSIMLPTTTKYKSMSQCVVVSILSITRAVVFAPIRFGDKDCLPTTCSTKVWS